MLLSEAFQVLGVEVRFDLSSRDLRAAWMRRASVAHPDAAGAVDESARVNDAMRVLSDPIQRARALLELRGAAEVEAPSLSPEFLLEMMELRERADECVGDAAATARLRGEAASRRDAAIGEIAAIFAASGAGSIARERAMQVAEQISVVRAFERMLEQLDREAGDGSPSP